DACLCLPLPGNRTGPCRRGCVRRAGTARVRRAVVRLLPGRAAVDRGLRRRASAAATPEDRGRARQAAGPLAEGEAVADPGAAAWRPGTGPGGAPVLGGGPAAAARGHGRGLSAGPWQGCAGARRWRARRVRPEGAV